MTRSRMQTLSGGTDRTSPTDVALVRHLVGVAQLVADARVGADAAVDIRLFGVEQRIAAKLDALDPAQDVRQSLVSEDAAELFPAPGHRRRSSRPSLRLVR